MRVLRLKFLKNPTCFKIHGKPTCIDHIFTSQPQSSQSSCRVNIGLSDFHGLTFTVLKTYFKKQEPIIIMNVVYKKYANQLFQEELVKELPYFL